MCNIIHDFINFHVRKCFICSYVTGFKKIDFHTRAQTHTHARSRHTFHHQMTAVKFNNSGRYWYEVSKTVFAVAYF